MSDGFSCGPWLCSQEPQTLRGCPLPVEGAVAPERLWLLLPEPANCLIVTSLSVRVLKYLCRLQCAASGSFWKPGERLASKQKSPKLGQGFGEIMIFCHSSAMWTYRCVCVCVSVPVQCCGLQCFLPLHPPSPPHSSPSAGLSRSSWLGVLSPPAASQIVPPLSYYMFTTAAPSEPR